MSATEPPIEFSDSLDLDAIRRTFARTGRAQVRPFLSAASADRLYACLSGELPWQLHLNDGERAISRDAAAFEALPSADRARLFDSIHASAAQRFQYVFYNFPLSDLYERDEYRSLYAMRVLEFLNSEPFLQFVRRVTGIDSIALADAQATLYKPGHFLTVHDDHAEDKHRVAAYVLNLTRPWSIDWGGVLQFVDADGHIAEGFVPTFNALNLFRVPQPHLVSLVAPFARAGRYSITGWLRQR